MEPSRSNDDRPNDEPQDDDRPNDERPDVRKSVTGKFEIGSSKGTSHSALFSFDPAPYDKLCTKKDIQDLCKYVDEKFEKIEKLIEKLTLDQQK